MIAGNLAFQQAATASGDSGTEAAIIWLAGTEAANSGQERVERSRPTPSTSTIADDGLLRQPRSRQEPDRQQRLSTARFCWTAADSVALAHRQQRQHRPLRHPAHVPHRGVAVQNANCLFSGAALDNNKQNIPLPQEICKGAGLPGGRPDPHDPDYLRNHGPEEYHQLRAGVCLLGATMKSITENIARPPASCCWLAGAGRRRPGAAAARAGRHGRAGDLADGDLDHHHGETQPDVHAGRFRQHGLGLPAGHGQEFRGQVRLQQHQLQRRLLQPQHHLFPAGEFHRRAAQCHRHHLCRRLQGRIRHRLGNHQPEHRLHRRQRQRRERHQPRPPAPLFTTRIPARRTRRRCRITSTPAALSTRNATAISARRRAAACSP